MTTLAFDLKGKIDPRIKKTINCGHLLNFFFFLLCGSYCTVSLVFPVTLYVGTILQ